MRELEARDVARARAVEEFECCVCVVDVLLWDEIEIVCVCLLYVEMVVSKVEEIGGFVLDV